MEERLITVKQKLVFDEALIAGDYIHLQFVLWNFLLNTDETIHFLLC